MFCCVCVFLNEICFILLKCVLLISFMVVVWLMFLLCFDVVFVEGVKIGCGSCCDLMSFVGSW